MTATPSTETAVQSANDDGGDPGRRVMYQDTVLLSAVNDGYVRTCGGVECAAVDMLITEHGMVVLELDDWLAVPLGLLD